MYSFRKITPADEAMFKHWLIHPHIGDWWKDGDTEWGLVAEDIDSPHIDMRIAQADGHPIGFIQDYNAHHWGMPQYAVFPPDTRAIDMFLGDPDYLGQGHASGFITARLADLKHIGTIVIDPDPTNTRAIRAYEKAGFRPNKITACEDGDPVHVMVYP